MKSLPMRHSEPHLTNYKKASNIASLENERLPVQKITNVAMF
jgi:hypothetical protein